MSYTYSPELIKGNLEIDRGDLKMNIDIVSQTQISLTGYDSISNPEINSGVIPYIQGLNNNTVERTKLTTLSKNSMNTLIKNRLISNLTISVSNPVYNYVQINVNCTDLEGNLQQIKWSNI